MNLANPRRCHWPQANVRRRLHLRAVSVLLAAGSTVTSPVLFPHAPFPEVTGTSSQCADVSHHVPNHLHLKITDIDQHARRHGLATSVSLLS